MALKGKYYSPYEEIFFHNFFSLDNTFSVLDRLRRGRDRNMYLCLLFVSLYSVHSSATSYLSALLKGLLVQFSGPGDQQHSSEYISY